MSTKRGRPIICVNCRTEFIQPFQSDRTFCGYNEECVQAGVLAKLHSQTFQDGDHIVWTGNVTTKFGIPRLDMHFDSRRVTRRVVDILLENKLGHTYPFVERVCHRERCVNLDHYMIAMKQSSARTIDAPLPLEPLMSMLRADAGLRLKLNSVMRSAESKGHFTVSQVDAVCCDHLGFNPALIYGDLFFTTGTQEEAA